MEQVLSLVWLPVTLAILSLLLPDTQVTRKLVAAGCWGQLLLAGNLLMPLLEAGTSRLALCEGLVFDRLGAAFTLLSILVVAAACTHADAYCANDEDGQNSSRSQLKMFYACTNVFLLAMTFVFACDNLAFLWIAIEATTLSTAPLVYFERTKHALEATWKYLIICSVGIAFALLGTVLIFASSQRGAFEHGTLSILQLTQEAKLLEFPLLRLGFFFCLIGYGTKAGVFPMHSWLPDAHSEAPAPASAMLSGALLNCALFGILRTLQIITAARPGYIASEIVIVLAALTAISASFFLIKQHSFKRVFAYSSMENVGLMLAAIGLGSGVLFFLQALNHSLAKVCLFLLAGNITQANGSKKLKHLHGVLSSCPSWGTLTAFATLAVTGAPPFGPFIAEVAILLETARNGKWAVFICLLIAITISFLAICAHVGKVLGGSRPKAFSSKRVLQTSLVPTALLLSSLALGLFVNIHALAALEKSFNSKALEGIRSDANTL